MTNDPISKKYDLEERKELNLIFNSIVKSLKENRNKSNRH